MSLDRPLLSISIPTYNRSRYLAELLEILLPQFVADSTIAARAELILCDNASTDDTEAMVAAFCRRGLLCRYVRSPENQGPEANFLQCLDLARGTYVWVLGDDDLVARDAVPQLLSLLQQDVYDLVYLSSAGFTPGQQPHFPHDKLGRFAEVITDGDYFLEKVNALIGLISVNIVNKDRLLQTPHPPITELNGTNLPQLGWLFPVLHRQCRILYVWERLVAYRKLNSGGWGICEVFGLGLHRIAQQYFQTEPSLTRSLMNGVLRYWMSDSILEMRLGKQQAMHSENFAETLRPVFSRNWRFWIFVYLVAVPPLSVARPLHGVLRLANKITRAAQAVLRHVFLRGRLVRP